MSFHGCLHLLVSCFVATFAPNPIYLPRVHVLFSSLYVAHMLRAAHDLMHLALPFTTLHLLPISFCVDFVFFQMVVMTIMSAILVDSPSIVMLRLPTTVCRRRVNWLSDCKASDELKAGDVISISGKGRLELRSASETKKGKFAIEMVRFM